MIGPHVHMGPIKTLPVKPWRYAFIVELGWFDIHTRIANHCGRRAGPRAFKFTRLIIYRRNENHNCDEDDDDFGDLIEWNISEDSFWDILLKSENKIVLKRRILSVAVSLRWGPIRKWDKSLMSLHAFAPFCIFDHILFLQQGLGPTQWNKVMNSILYFILSCI